MSNTIRIKRRLSGPSGAPTSLENAELAFTEVDDILYYGKGVGGLGGSATAMLAIGGPGAFLTLSGSSQTVSSDKVFTGSVNLSGATSVTVPTVTAGDNSTKSASTAFVQNALASYLPTTGGTISSNLTINGDLTVKGTTTTINSTQVDVADKNIVLGNVTTPSDATADGGGITLLGTSSKEIKWLDATDSWTFSEHVDLANGKAYYINGVQVLSGSSLGTGVTGSSLTSVGTLTSGSLGSGFTTVAVARGGTGQTSYTDGQLLIGNTATGGLSKSALTAGTGIDITNSNGGITISAQQTLTQGDGITISGGSVSVNRKVNGGLVIESSALAVDLGASSITGTLAIADGGTGATDASTARSNLGLGTIATQASNNVSITGGSIDNITFDGGTY